VNFSGVNFLLQFLESLVGMLRLGQLPLPLFGLGARGAQIKFRAAAMSL
jgi:hypothetical protein